MTTASAQSPGDEAAQQAANVPGQNASQQGGAETAQEAGTNAAPPPTKEQKTRAWRKLRTWFLMAVVFAMLPTLGQHVSGLQRMDYTNPGLFVLAAKADLFVVSMGLAAQALVQCYDRSRSEALNLWSLVNVLVLAFTTYLAATANADGVSETRVGIQSLIILGFTLVSAGRTTYLCELEAKQ